MKTPQQVKIGTTTKTIKEGMCNTCKGGHFKGTKAVGKVKSL